MRSKTWKNLPEVNPTWQALQDEALAKKFEPKRLKALTRNQGIYMRAVETSTVTLVTGPAGCGKSYIACGLAAQMLAEDRVDRVILSNPCVDCGPAQGFLPGDQREKVLPYMMPMLEALAEFCGPRLLEKYEKDGRLELVPLQKMRGRTFHNCFICADETQNASYEQLMMLLTRFGRNSRMVVCGDTKQTDLGQTSPLIEVINRLWNLDPDISVVQLTKDDIVRHGLISKIVEALS